MPLLRRIHYKEKADEYLLRGTDASAQARVRLEYAFDALYLYFLSVVEEPFFALDHPKAVVLWEAASDLGIDVEEISPLVHMLDERRQRVRDDASVEAILAMARRVQQRLQEAE